MRRFDREIVTKSRYSKRRVLNNGLKKVNIGEDVWLIGRQKVLKDGREHSVIYGPNRKEYHVYDKDLKFILNPVEERDPWYYGYDSEKSYISRDGNRAVESKLKIYILTRILDKEQNWELNLNKKPKNGPLKVIYDNGTVKNIEFNGEFEKVKIRNKYCVSLKREVSPFGYRNI